MLFDFLNRTFNDVSYVLAIFSFCMVDFELMVEPHISVFTLNVSLSTDTALSALECWNTMVPYTMKQELTQLSWKTTNW